MLLGKTDVLREPVVCECRADAPIKNPCWVQNILDQSIKRCDINRSGLIGNAC
jgi:hypothetical protein